MQTQGLIAKGRGRKHFANGALGFSAEHLTLRTWDTYRLRNRFIWNLAWRKC